MTTPVITEPKQGSATNPKSWAALLVEAALGMLGTTSDTVADTLRSMSVTGVRHDEMSCPIAHLLTRLDAVETAEVLDDHVHIWATGTADQVPIVIDLPAPVAEFVTRFDEGVHLDMVTLPAAAVK